MGREAPALSELLPPSLLAAADSVEAAEAMVEGVLGLTEAGLNGVQPGALSVAARAHEPGPLGEGSEQAGEGGGDGGDVHFCARFRRALAPAGRWGHRKRGRFLCSLPPGSGAGRVLEGAEARPFLCSLPPGSGSGWALEVFPRALAIGPDGRGVGGCSRGGLMRWAMAAPFAPSALRQAQDRQAPSWEGRTGQDERFSAWAGPEKSGGVRGRSRLALGMRAVLRPFFFPPTRPGGMGAADGSRRSLLRQAASWEGRMRSG